MEAYAIMQKLIFVLFCIAGNDYAWTHKDTYTTDQFDLQYVISTPGLLSPNTKLPVWIYQDGDGFIRNKFSTMNGIALTSVLAWKYNVAVVYAELRRHRVANDLPKYCALDFNHRMVDLNALINQIKTYKFVDQTKIVLVGHSAGSEVVTKVANERSDIAAVATMGGGVLQLADYLDLAEPHTLYKSWITQECTSQTYEQRSGTFWQQLLYSGLFEEVARFRKPYLMILGDYDAETRADLQVTAIRQIELLNPNFSFKEVKGMGHNIFLQLHPFVLWDQISEMTQKL